MRAIANGLAWSLAGAAAAWIVIAESHAIGDGTASLWAGLILGMVGLSIETRRDDTWRRW